MNFFKACLRIFETKIIKDREITLSLSVKLVSLQLYRLISQVFDSQCTLNYQNSEWLSVSLTKTMTVA